MDGIYGRVRMSGGRRSEWTAPHSSFTLIEMLIVIAIILVLAGMLTPALNSAMETARSVECLSNERNTYMQMSAYANDNQNFIPAMRNIAGSVGSWTGWTDMLYNGGYLNISNYIYSCPKSYPSTPPIATALRNWCFGINYYAYNRNNDKVQKVITDTASGDVYTGIYTPASRQPSKLILTHDNMGWLPYENLGIKAQYNHTGYFWLRHQLKASVSFLDGHGQMLSDTDIGGLLPLTAILYQPPGPNKRYYYGD